MRPARSLGAALALAGSALAAGCNVSAPVIGTIPPFLIDKNVFRPERLWYSLETILDAPFATQVVSYVGYSYPLEKLRWSVQQNLLVGYRGYSLYYGDPSIGPGITDHSDPVRAFKIIQHCDIFNGQVIVPPNKSWADMQYIQVDWSVNLVNEYDSSTPVYAPVAYDVSDPHDPNAPIVTDDYIEAVAHYSYAEPTASDPSRMSSSAPVCGYTNGELMDCVPGEFTTRRSFRVVPQDDDYQPIEESDSDYQRFGYFRKEMLYVDPNWGPTLAGHRYWLERWNIWKKSHDAAGNPLPYRDRAIRPIVYYLSGNWPDYLLPAVRLAVDDWNGAFRDAVNGARYWECIDGGGSAAACQAAKDPNLRVVKLCPNNPVQPGDDPDCGPPGTQARMGDIRFNTIEWVDNETESAIAGVGWFNTDHETGELVPGAAVYMNGPANLFFAYQDALAIQMMNGDVQMDALTLDGDLTAQYINSLFLTDPWGPYPVGTIGQELKLMWKPGQAWPGLTFPAKAPLTQVDLQQRFARMNTSWVGNLALPALDTSSWNGLQASLAARLQAFQDSPYAGNAAQAQARLQSLLGTPFEDALIDQEMLTEGGIADASLYTADQVRQAASPLRNHGAPPLPTASNVIEEPARTGVFDPVYMYYAPAMKGLSIDEVARNVLISGMRGLVEHEIGHTLGLEHNFTASFDSFNYWPQYWQIRNDGQMGPRWRDPLTPQQIQQGIDEYQYSSVMDYFATTYERMHGIGHYDRAAIKYAYAGLTEVLDDPLAAQNGYLANQIQQWNNSFSLNGVFVDRNGNPFGLHYTQYPSLFGDLENREDVPTSHLVDLYGTGEALDLPDGRPAVPYRVCDDSETAYVSCHPDDRGADGYEIIMDGIQRYYAYYEATHFPMDVTGYVQAGASIRSPPDINALYLSTLLPAEYQLGKILIQVPDLNQVMSDDGLAATALMVSEGFDFLTAILAAPEPGSYAPATVPGNPTYQEFQGYGTPGSWNVPLGDGRFYTTITAQPEAGGNSTDNYYSNVIAWGNEDDKQAALAVLTGSTQFFPYPQTVPDVRSTNGSFYLIYPDLLNSLMGAVLSGDWNEVGPAIDPSAMSLDFRQWATGEVPWSPAPGSVVDPKVPFGLRRYLQTILLASAVVGPDSAVLDSARLVVDGEGDAFTTNLPTVSFADPSSGKTYRAISKMVNGQETGIAARMLVHANALLAATTDPTLSSSLQAQAASNLAAYTQEVEYLRRLNVFFAD